MSAARIFSTVILAGVAACSGYDGGGDVRIVPLADSGATVADGGRVPPLDASTPRDSGIDSAVPKQSTLFAYYPLDGHVDDRSPSSSAPKRHLELMNGSFTSGQVGTAFLMTNHGYAAERPEMDPELAFGDGDFTIQAWLSSGSNAAVGFGTGALGASVSDGWMLSVTQGNVGWKTNDPRGILSQSLPSSSAMRHVVARRATGLLSLFVNGQVVATRDNTTSIGPQRRFAIHQTLSTSNTSSRVDEIVIWSRALSDTEVGTLYARGQSGQPADLSE